MRISVTGIKLYAFETSRGQLHDYGYFKYKVGDGGEEAEPGMLIPMSFFPGRHSLHPEDRGKQDPPKRL
jgi:hypothetical protein